MGTNKRIKRNIVLALVCAMCSSAFGVSASEYMSKDVVLGYEFEDTMHGFDYLKDDNTTMKNEDGKWIVNYVDSQPWLPGFTMQGSDGEEGIPADEVTEVVIAAQSEKDMIYKIFYRTTLDGNWSEAQKVETKINGGENMREYRIDVTNDSKWAGRILTFRIDFLGAEKRTNTVTTDYIRLIGKETTSITTDDKGFKFELVTNSAADGLGISESVSNANLSGGVLKGDITGEDASVHTNGIAAFAAKDYGSVSIKYRNNTSAEKAYLYFACDGSGGKYTEDYRFELDVVPNDNKVREYIIATGDNKNWLGNITGLKFDFGASEGSFELDELGVYKYPYTVSTSNDTLKVSGKLTPNDITAIQVVKAEYEDILGDIEQNGNYTDAVIYTDDMLNDAEGNFEFSYPLEPSEDPQDFVIMIADSNKKYTSRVAYIDSEYANRALVKINAAVESGRGIYDEVTKSYAYLGIESVGYYDYLGKYSNVSDFETQMIENGVSSDLSELETSIAKASVFALMKACTQSDLPANAEKYEDILKLKENTSYEIYAELQKSEQAEVLNAARENAADLEELGANFAEKAIIYGIKFNMGADKIREIMEENAEVIGIDTSKASKLKNPDKVYVALAGHSYDSFEDIQKAFNDSVQKCKDNEKDSGSTGSSSSGSGGGGSSSIVKPSITYNPGTPSVKPTEEIFADLNAHWAKESIINLYKKGIVSGKSKTEFFPEDTVTREEFVKMIVNAFGFKDSADIDLTDVDAEAWYYEFICRAVNAGIIKGNPDGTFGIGKGITREDMAVIIFRCINETKSQNGDINFADTDEISEYAKEAVNALAKLGIIKGTPAGAFAPKAFASRAETAVIIERILSYIGG